MKIEIYCDGSATTADKPGGFAYVIVKDEVEIHRGSGGLRSATNNVAEIQAAISGLEHTAQLMHNGVLPSDAEIELVSDSQLVLRYATGEYKCKAMHLVPLYIKLRKLYAQVGAKTRWVKGHSGNQYNEICDKLAKAARESVQA